MKATERILDMQEAFASVPCDINKKLPAQKNTTCSVSTIKILKN